MRDNVSDQGESGGSQLRSHPMIKSSVICFWISDDKFPCPLVTSIDTNAGIGEPFRTQKRHQLEEKIGLSLEQVGGFLSNSVLE